MKNWRTNANGWFSQFAARRKGVAWRPFQKLFSALGASSWADKRAVWADAVADGIEEYVEKTNAEALAAIEALPESEAQLARAAFEPLVFSVEGEGERPFLIAIIEFLKKLADEGKFRDLLTMIVDAIIALATFFSGLGGIILLFVMFCITGGGE